MGNAAKPPALSPKALGDLHVVEKLANALLRDCNGIPYNLIKAGEILSSCLIQAFDIRVGFYSSVPTRDIAWIEQIANHSINASFGMLPFEARHASILEELRRILRDHIESEHSSLTARFTAPSNLESPAPPIKKTPGISELERRAKLLADYKRAAGNPSNRKIYSARNSGIHKPEFYDWVKGKLTSGSQTCINFERFLREKKPPIPKKA